MRIVDIKKNYSKVLEETARTIKNGGLVVYPSDTVYILAVDPTNEKAVKKLLGFKERWTGKAISIAVLNKKMAEEYVELSENGQNIYSNLLPGPFTIVSKGKHKTAKGIEAENGTLGIRIPDNKYINDLVKKLGKPITATSANLSGRTPNYSVKGFLKTLSKKKIEMIDLIVDAGKLPKNKPSTVIDATEPEIKILRRGDLITGNAKTLISKSEKETEKIAKFLLGRSFLIQNPSNSPFDSKGDLNTNKPIVFLLSGDLGCGKTVFSRKIGHLLGVKEKITSPTFFIYNEYNLDRRSSIVDRRKIDKFLHFDLYKISTDYELEEIKFFELFKPNTISCIEWPENMGKKNLEKLEKITNCKNINFRYVDEETREIKFDRRF
jgi:L-threonylcarbamoyladenylate synthase